MIYNNYDFSDLKPCNLSYLKIEKYDEETFYSIADSIEFYEAFKDDITPGLVDSHDFKKKGILKFNSSYVFGYYNSFNLQRRVDEVEQWFNQTKRAISQATYYSKICAHYANKKWLKQVRWIEDVFKENGVKIEYKIVDDGEKFKKYWYPEYERSGNKYNHGTPSSFKELGRNS
jgi:hypothetical protein